MFASVLLFQKYYNNCMYSLARGQEKVNYEKKKEASEVMYHTSRVMEVGLESSFQPTIQLYLLLPALVRNLAHKENLNLLSICWDSRHGSKFLPGIRVDQTVSVITSLLSLAKRFTSHQAAMKRGALANEPSTLAVLFTAILLKTISRLLMFVLFAYSFGPGNK